jgi:hypothetical protein
MHIDIGARLPSHAKFSTKFSACTSMWNLDAQKQRGFPSKADGICRYYRYSCISQNQTAQSDTQHVLSDFQHNQGRPTVLVVSFYLLYQSARPERQ